MQYYVKYAKIRISRWCKTPIKNFERIILQMEYDIVRSLSLEEVIDKVNRRLKEKWELNGETFTIKRGNAKIICQPMKKYGESDEKL